MEGGEKRSEKAVLFPVLLLTALLLSGGALFHRADEPARRCTAVWSRDLKEQLQKDGRWE